MIPATQSFSTLPVGRGCLLDSRRALWHPVGSWLAINDVHHGIELNRVRRLGPLPEAQRMGATEQRVIDLIDCYAPQVLVLNGDIMDGGGSIGATQKMIHRLRERVRELVLVEGNHDRAALRREEGFVTHHRIGEFIFHHGHKWGRTWKELDGLNRGEVHICGHEHPAVQIKDGKGLSLLLPALVQEMMCTPDSIEHWVLPAFSPWAGGSRYACGEGWVVPLHAMGM
jgi:uncharacterized protein